MHITLSACLYICLSFQTVSVIPHTYLTLTLTHCMRYVSVYVYVYVYMCDAHEQNVVILDLRRPEEKAGAGAVIEGK